ncbi:TIGR02679 family protein [Micromonospora azadirachtae]|uniref:TIGR02679 family protein n=1 Tax=Micromonospora azadirachtae TaxID=1970735 RepID=A0ABW2ZVN1_9ACTN
MIPEPIRAQLLEAFPMNRWAWLRQDVRAHLERRRDAATVSITTTSLDQATVDSLRWLLQLPAPLPPSLNIKLRNLDRALTTRTDWGLATRELLEALDGPLEDHRAARRRVRDAAESLWITVAAHPQVATNSVLQRWLAAEASLGALPAEVEIRKALLDDALAVLDAVSAADGITVTRLAANALGPAHALDKGPLANLVLRALAYVHDQSPTTLAQPRTLWKLAGLKPDDLSSRVLLTGFRPTGTTALESVLRIHAGHGEPAVITLRQIQNYLDTRPEPLLPTRTRIWVCENVAVTVEAANSLGADCPPLICIEGWPSQAANLLLQHLASRGADIVYHGDFDWEGLAITDVMMRLGAKPWRMDQDSYLAAVSRIERLPELPPPDGILPDYPWAPGLVPSMIDKLRRVEEEHLIGYLLADLTAASSTVGSAGDRG